VDGGEQIFINLMPKYFTFAALVLLTLAACRQKSAKSTIDKKGTSPQKVVKRREPAIVYKTPLLNEYASFIDSISSPRIENSTIAAKKYQSLFKSAGADIRDTAFTIFDKYYERLTDKLDNSAERESIDLDTYFAYSTSHPKVPQKVAQYVKRLTQNGFRVGEEEGMCYIQQDRDFVATWFYNYVSPVMKKYLIQLNKENKLIYMEDAGITINYDELVDRALWWEQFVKNQPYFIAKKSAVANQRTYLTLLIEGSDNTWVMDPETKKLDDYFKKAYADVENKSPSSDVGKTVIPYYHLLLNGQTASADSLLRDYRKRNIIGDN